MEQFQSDGACPLGPRVAPGASGVTLSERRIIMGKLDISKTAEINVNPSKAWEVIGPNFLNIADWGRGIKKSWNNESAKKTFEDAPAGGRFCDVTGFGKFDERIIHYESEKLEITWSATGEKLPSFISGLQNALHVEQIDENSCRINAHITADLNGIKGTLMGPMLKKNFSKTVEGFLKDWKEYAETGHVSGAKQKELAR
jgi:hypothetical protein